ncbi:MAG: pyrimidine 5'-nucleotidase [Anaerolineales bacterium]
MAFKTLLFDLDATLYPAENGFWAEIAHRIELYLIERMGISPDKTTALKTAYYHEYGTTLRGLQHHHHIDPKEYLQFVHNIPTERYLQPDQLLREMILALPQQKWIFTNSDFAHATRVLAALGLADCFDGIISLETLAYECKPHPSVYQMALQITGASDPRQVLYLDDSLRNLAPAHAMGIYTVHVGPSLSPNGTPLKFSPDLSIHRPHELVHALPELLTLS